MATEQDGSQWSLYLATNNVIIVVIINLTISISHVL